MSGRATSQPQRGRFAVRNQTTESLVQLSADWGIAPGQVAAIVESPNSTLTLFFEPTAEQRELHAEWARSDARG